MARVLVIDDDVMICRLLADIEKCMGHDVSHALTLKNGLAEAVSEAYDLVFLDIRLPDGNGLAAIPRIRKTPSAPEVIIITGAADPDGAELALKSGAWDYIEKSASNESIRLPFSRALQFREHKAAPSRAAGSSRSLAAIKRGIIGGSPEMRNCLELLAQAAESEANVLITGETGTGKELFARAIHQNSEKSENACAALTESLVESVLSAMKRRVHRSDQIPRRDDPASRRRHTLSRRGGRASAFRSESLSAGSSGTLFSTGGRESGSLQQLQAACRDQSGSRSDGLVRRVSKRPFFPSSIPYDRAPSPAHPNRGHPGARLISYDPPVRAAGNLEKDLSPEFLESLERYAWPGNVRELVHVT